jgi:hypothetical protein
MIDFFQEGSNIGFSLNGWSGALLLIYIMIEISFLIISKSFLIHKIFLWFVVRNKIRKAIPKWWSIDRISLLTIYKRNSNYEVFVKLSYKPSGDISTNDYVKVNFFGEMVEDAEFSLLENIKLKDMWRKDQIKQWSRDNTLEKLGI